MNSAPAGGITFTIYLKVVLFNFVKMKMYVFDELQTSRRALTSDKNTVSGALEHWTENVL